MADDENTAKLQVLKAALTPLCSFLSCNKHIHWCSNSDTAAAAFAAQSTTWAYDRSFGSDTEILQACSAAGIEYIPVLVWQLCAY